MCFKFINWSTTHIFRDNEVLFVCFKENIRCGSWLLRSREPRVLYKPESQMLKLQGSKRRFLGFGSQGKNGSLPFPSLDNTCTLPGNFANPKQLASGKRHRSAGLPGCWRLDQAVQCRQTQNQISPRSRLTDAESAQEQLFPCAWILLQKGAMGFFLVSGQAQSIFLREERAPGLGC